MFRHLRAMREDHDLSQKALAEHLKIHQTTYSDYELGNINIPVPILIRLAEFFHTSVDYLIDLTDEPDPYPRMGKKSRRAPIFAFAKVGALLFRPVPGGWLW